MGIQGLLPLLKSIQVHTHISSFKDQTLGVDGYVWLHKGGFACAPQLVQGQKTTKYVDYVMHRIRMLRHYGVEPYLVFDGGPLPAKKGTESERSKNREENLAKAKALQARGQHTLAREYFTKCLDVTPEMAYQVIKALKKESVSYTVAPYEADAQLTYLEQTGIIDGIITEDSDLLVFGCKKVIFKMDPDGNCVCIERDRFGSNVDLSLAGWGDKEFRRMAMLSGCDYLPSITGMGIKTAHKLLRKFKTVEKVLQHLRVDSNLRVPKEYYESFVMAELPFLYQRVYCPIKEQLTYLTPLSDFEEWSPEKEAYVGRDLDAELAKGIAEGSVDPISLEPMVDINPSYTPHIQGQKHAVKVKPKPEKGTLTNYFRVVPKDQPSTSSAIPRRPTIHIGNSSGLKTLSEQMESERSTKQAKQCANDEGLATSSKFFAQPSVTTGRETTPPLASKRKRCDEDSAIFTPRAPRRTRPEKENEPIEIIDPVMQEPGYQSPCSIADVSSPIERMSIADDVEDHARSASPQWKVDNIQSPSQVCTPRRSPLHSRILCQETPPLVPSQKASLVLVLDTPPPNAVQDLSQSQSFGIDLRDTFRDDHDDGSDGDSSGPETPEDTQLEEHANVLAVEQDVIDLTKSDFDDIEVLADDEAQKVMNGWRTQWNHKVSSKNKLKLPLMPETLEDDTFLVTPSAETVSTPTATAPVRAALFSASRATRPSGSVAKQKNSRAPRKSTGSIPTTSKQPKARGRVSLDSKPTSSSSTLTQSLLNFRYSR